MATKPYIIALEEHYFDAEVKKHFTGIDAHRRRGSSSGSTMSAHCA